MLLALIMVAGTLGEAQSAKANAVQVQMRNVQYHFTAEVAVHITTLNGALVPTEGNPLPIFDDKNSFVLHIAQAEIGMTAASLTTVLNKHVLAASDAPIKDVSVQIDKGKIKIKGKLHSKGDVPFETEGMLSVTPDGKLRLHAEKIRAAHLPVKGLMDLFGVELSDLVKSGKVRGLQPEGDDIILDPAQLLPPPRIAGKVVAVRIQGNEIVQTFGGEKVQPFRVDAQNYMAYRGNQLRFGKLTMTDTDMDLIDMTPQDPFDFSLDLYKKMLTAGYTRITPTFGLRVYMKDVNKLGGAGAPAHAPTKPAH